MGMRRWTGIVVLAGLAVLPGCVGYASYPRQADNKPWIDPSLPAFEDVLVASLQWAAKRYPPSAQGPTGPFAVNLPPGIVEWRYRRIVEAVGPDAAPLATDTAQLPTYHVREVKLRGDEARVELTRPVLTLGASPSGGVLYQDVTIRLRGGSERWHVVSDRPWTLGSAQAPAPNYIDAPGADAVAGHPAGG